MSSEQRFYKQASGLDVTDQDISNLTQFVKNEINNNEIKQEFLRVLNGILILKDNLALFHGENKLIATEVQETITKYKKQTHSDKVIIRELEDDNQLLREELKLKNTMIESLQRENSSHQSQHYSHPSNIRSVFTTPETSFSQEQRYQEQRIYRDRLLETDHLAECD